MASFPRTWWRRRPGRRRAAVRAFAVVALLVALVSGGAAPWLPDGHDDCCCRGEHACLCQLIDARAKCSRIGSGPADCSLGGATAPPSADVQRLTLPPVELAVAVAGADEPVGAAVAEPEALSSVPPPPPATPPPRSFRSA